MSEKTTTEFFCDRCGKSIGLEEPDSKLTVRACLEGEWAMVFAYDWRHFCANCHDLTTAFFTRKEKS